MTRVKPLRESILSASIRTNDACTRAAISLPIRVNSKITGTAHKLDTKISCEGNVPRGTIASLSKAVILNTANKVQRIS